MESTISEGVDLRRVIFKGITLEGVGCWFPFLEDRLYLSKETRVNITI
jgi:hypothetical protein